MDSLRTAVNYLAFAALLVAMLQVYLTTNKLWKRKHEKPVAESISIMGETLGLLPLMVLSLKFLLDGQWLAAADTSLWIVTAIVAITVGSGRWVEGRRGAGLLRLLWNSIAMERDEVGYLAKSFFRPSGARSILNILGQVALLDNRLDEREKSFIEAFAANWGVTFSWEELHSERSGADLDFIRLRNDVGEYLSSSPPPEQVSQLSDVVKKLAAIDDEVTAEEAMMVAEVTAMMDRYLHAGTTDASMYHLAIVPQDAEQDKAIRAVLPNLEKSELNGGQVYVAGSYHSFDFAELVGAQYRALNFFTAVVRVRAGGSPGEAMATASP